MEGDGSRRWPDDSDRFDDLESFAAFEADAEEPGLANESRAAPPRSVRNPDVERRIDALEIDRAIAEESGDAFAEAKILAKLATQHERLSATDAARDALSRARLLYETAGEDAAAASMVVALGNLESRLRRSEVAARLFKEAADLYQRQNDPQSAADALLSEADALAKVGRGDAARERVEAAEALFAQVDDTLGQAHTAYRVAMLLLIQSPDVADEQLELAARLFGDHVSRDVEQIDVALPESVTDSRRYPPFVMQRICLRERQKLGGVARSGHPSARGPIRRGRGDSEVSSGPQSSTLPTWIGVGLLLVGMVAFLGPQLVSEGGPLEAAADALGMSGAAATMLHIGMGAIGAITAMVAAYQLGISAPVVLIALALGVGMIFHEVGRAAFPGVVETPAPESAVAAVEDEAARLARTEAANHLLKGRSALESGNLAAARAAFENAYALSRGIAETKGQARALEELLILESEHGTVADQVAVAERLSDDLRGFDEERGREVIEHIVALSTRLDDRPRLREAHLKLLAYHERTGNTQGEVAALMALAALDRDTGNLDAAYDWYQRAHSSYQTLRDTKGQVGTLLAMGEIDARLGHNRRAYGHYYHAFAMYRELNDTSGQAAMLLHMGTIDERSERYEEAIAAFRQAERLFNQVGEPAGEALAALRFGTTQVAHGNQRQAREGFLRSLELFRAVGDLRGQARAQLGLGNHWLKVGDRDEASRHYEQARALYARLDDATGQLAALREMAIIAQESGSSATAGSRLAEARRVTREVTDPVTRAGLLLSAGDLALSLDRADEAVSTYREALVLYEALGDDLGRRAADERLSRAQAAG